MSICRGIVESVGLLGLERKEQDLVIVSSLVVSMGVNKLQVTNKFLVFCVGKIVKLLRFLVVQA